MIPIFAIETPSFMGLGGNEQEECEESKRMDKLKGNKYISNGHISKCYVHGSLQDKLGFDIARFCAGDINCFLGTQQVLVYDMHNKAHLALLCLEEKTEGEFWGLIVEDNAFEISNAFRSLKRSNTVL